MTKTTEQLRSTLDDFKFALGEVGNAINTTQHLLVEGNLDEATEMVESISSAIRELREVVDAMSKEVGIA